jgi:aspartyl-tRNA(Asn)/glutamyl-tRNA(Gln) amidotransferase subunit B
LPALPAERRASLAAVAGVSAADVALAVERDLDGLASRAIEAGGDPARVITHIDNNLAVDGATELDPAHLARLTELEVNGDVTATQAKEILADMVGTGRDPETIAAERGYEAMDTGALESVVDSVIADNPSEWTQFVEGDDDRRRKLAGFFVGKVMKATQGKADGKAVTSLLHQRAAQG